MIKTTDKSIYRLALSAVMILIALIWLFYGNALVSHFTSEGNEQVVYAFFSGVVLTFGLVGLYIFTKTVLSVSEFIVDSENLPIMMYRSVLEDDSEGVFFKDMKGRYCIINHIAQQVLDFEDKQVIGFKDSQLLSTIEAIKTEAEDKKVLEQGESIIWETEKVTGLGIESFLCKKVPCRDRSGKIIGITGLCKNITVLKTFQNLNTELEERYRQLFNRLPYPVMVLDVSTMLPFTFNQSMADLLGYSKIDLANTRFTTHTAEENTEIFRKTLAMLVEKHGGEFEIQLTTRDRDVLDISGYAQKINIENKQFLHIIFRDLTEVKKSTDELINSELKYRSLFEHANDAILIVDIPTLHIIDANDKAMKLLDYRIDDLASMTIYDFDVSSKQQVTQQKLNDLEIYNHVLYEHEFCNRKNICYPVEINAHKVNYGNEEVYQFIVRNINERKDADHIALVKN